MYFMIIIKLNMNEPNTINTIENITVKFCLENSKKHSKKLPNEVDSIALLQFDVFAEFIFFICFKILFLKTFFFLNK